MAVETLPGAQTTTYGIQICHTHDEGIDASPVAGDEGENASIVRLHSPFERISVYWTAVSEGKPPILPSHRDYANNYNRVFTGGERVGIVTPNLIGHLWMAAGRFDFVVVGPEGLDSAFALARCPWEGTDADDFYIPVNNFVDGLLNDIPTRALPIGPGAPAGFGLMALPITADAPDTDPDVPLINLMMATQG